MRIVFTLPTLYPGGAERTVSNLANYWADRGWPVTIMTLNHQNRPAAFPLYPNVTHRDIAYHESLNRRPPEGELETCLKRIIESSSGPEQALIRAEWNKLQPLRDAMIRAGADAILCFESASAMRVLMACGDLDVPIIVSERSDPHHLLMKNDAWTALRRRLYLKAAAVVTLTEEGRQYFSGPLEKKCRVIPNFVVKPDPRQNAPAYARMRQRTVVAMGRLEYVKGFDLLLGAFALIASRHPEWSLHIWGAGGALAELSAQASQLGIQHRVTFAGFTSSPHQSLSEADLFVLSSRYEGFPNALCEAMASGLAVVSFDCPSGPRNIIRNGVDGMLVPALSVEALAEAMGSLMADEAQRRTLGSRAAEIVQRFSPEKIMPMWEELVLSRLPQNTCESC